MEKWKKIKGYDCYLVSDQGRVKSVKFGKERILKAAPNKFGYLSIHLWDDGKKKTVYIHKLVAEYFIVGCDNDKKVIHHINEIKTDNRVSNLEYLSYSENLTYGKAQEKRASKWKRKRHIWQYTSEGLLLFVWTDINEIPKIFYTDKSCIYACCNGYLKQNSGYIWSYEPLQKAIV